MSGYIDELGRMVERAHLERRGWAVAVATHVQWAIDNGGDLNDVPMRHALVEFRIATGRESLALDLRALENYGVFWERVTPEMLKARWAAADADRAATVRP